MAMKGTSAAAAILVAGLGMAVIAAQGPPPKASPPKVDPIPLWRRLPPNNLDDFDLLVSRCGPPNAIETTAHDVPRPPIPAQVADYWQARVEFLYIPGGGAKVTDDPPYRWRLAGIQDRDTHQVLSVDEATARMPCWRSPT